METMIALLRAVNVGGTGKMPMSDLRALCADAGLADVRTYIQSGNVVFRSALAEADVQAALEARLSAYAGGPMQVILRSARAMAEILARNPFPEAAPNRVGVLFLDTDAPVDPAAGAKGRRDEEIVAGGREIFVHFPSGMGRSRLRLPQMDSGTLRNLNTVRKLDALATAPL